MDTMDQLSPPEIPGDSSGKRVVFAVPDEGLAVWLPFCMPFLEKAIEKSDGEMTGYGLRADLYAGASRLLIECVGTDPQGCVAITFYQYHNFKAAHILAIAALPDKQHPYPNSESFALLAEWCKQQGATKLQGAATEAVARLWSRIHFREAYRIMRIDL